MQPGRRDEWWSGPATGGRPRAVLLPDVAALGPDVRDQVVRQEGVARTVQLLAGGVAERTVARRVASGRWQRLHPGVVVLQSGEVSWRQTAHAALLAAGAGAVLSHTSAAFVHGLARAPGAAVVVSVPAPRHVAARPGVVVRRRRVVPPASGRLRAVVREETVVDLLHDAVDEDAAVAALTAAVRCGVPADRVLDAVARRRAVRHRALARSVLGDPDLGIESPLEHRYLRDVERRHALPRSTGQVWQRVAGGWIRADRVYDGLRVRVELDGRLAHPGGATDRDVWRDNAVLLEHRDLTLRYRWAHVVGHPCDVALQVATALTRAGRPTSPRRCTACP